MRAFVKRHSLPLYFVLAFAWFWGLLALDRVKPFHFWAPLVGALAPTVAALVVAGAEGGEPAVRALGGRLLLWRVRWTWYLVAFGLPLAEGVVAIGIASGFGVFKWSQSNAQMLGASLPALWVAFLFAGGEELGWRGFALPRLLERRSAILATLVVGGMHALWHWPLLLLPHQWLSGIPLLPWTVSVLAEAFVFTWIIRGTGGSVLVAALFHGMANIVMVGYDGIDPHWMPWLKCGVTVLATVVLMLATGPSLMCRSTPSEAVAPAAP